MDKWSLSGNSQTDQIFATVAGKSGDRYTVPPMRKEYADFAAFGQDPMQQTSNGLVSWRIMEMGAATGSACY